jgi:hypothetical protein
MGVGDDAGDVEANVASSECLAGTVVSEAERTSGYIIFADSFVEYQMLKLIIVPSS